MIMAQDVRRRQKQLARKKAKRKEKRRSLVKRDEHSAASAFARVEHAPILHACATTDVFDLGIGNVLLSRELPNGRVALALFLVDRYCLGVKDAMWNVVTRAEYENSFLAKLNDRYEFIPYSAESTRHLVESAVDYAAQFGLAPHSDYHKAKLIFRGIDANDSADEFEYGKDGKPYFVAGPYDSPERCARILAALTEHCGEDGFDYLMPLGSSVWED